VVRPFGASPSGGRGDVVNVSDFGTVGGIGLGAGNSLSASDNAVSRGPDIDALGVRSLSASVIDSRGPTSHILGSNDNNFDTTDSGVFGTGAG
jgi:hypothetical protein